jgi:hypothetical protein
MRKYRLQHHPRLRPQRVKHQNGRYLLRDRAISRFVKRRGEDEAPPHFSVQQTYWRVITPVSGLLSAVRIVTTVATPAELKLPSVRYAPLVALPNAPLKPETE